MPPNAAAAAAGIAPEPCFKVWNTSTWSCEHSIPCGDDIVALVVQEYPPDVYAALAARYQSALQASTPSTSSSSSVNAPPTPLPSYQVISAQVGRPTHHHSPKLRLRVWEFEPAALASAASSAAAAAAHPTATYAASAGGRWLVTKEYTLAPACVKNPVLFVIDAQRLLVGNYRTVQIWNTRSSVCERELKLDATLRSFVLCSCGNELLGRSVRDIRAWDTRTWIATRAMPAKLGGDHRAKLASCLALHRNRMIFPMRDCIIACDPHTGTRFQKFSLPPDPRAAPSAQQASVITVSPALGGGSLMSAAALSNPDAWLLSSFVLTGDLLVVATYQGWLGIFSIKYDKLDQAQADAAAAAATAPAAGLVPALAGYALDGEMLLHCERYWQTAGSGVDKGAVVNALAVVTSTAPAHAPALLHASSLSRAPRGGLGFDAAAAALASASIAPSSSSSSSSLPAGGDAMEVASISGGVVVDDSMSPPPADVQAQVEAVVSGVVTVLDYGSMLAVWRKC